MVPAARCCAARVLPDQRWPTPKWDTKLAICRHFQETGATGLDPAVYPLDRDSSPLEALAPGADLRERKLSCECGYPEPQLDKLGVTGSSPVPPIEKSC